MMAAAELRQAISDVLAEAEAMPRPERGAPTSAHPELSLTATQMLPLGAEINATAWLDVNGDGVSDLICARDDGSLVATGMDGQVHFDIPTGDSPLLCVWAGELGGERTIISGARDGMVRCYDPTGILRWEHRNVNWGYGSRPSVYSLAVGDFDGDGADELVLGCHGGVTLMDLSAQPTVVRFTEVYSHVIDVLLPVRPMDDGQDWLALNASGGGLKLVDPVAGVVVDSFAQFWGGEASYAAPHTFNGDETWFVHAGANGVGAGQLLREPWMAGERAKAALWSESSWYRRTDGETRAVLVRDPDADGAPEIITGNETGFVVAYDHLGQRLWEKLIDTPVNAVASADLTGDGQKELVVAGDGPGLTLIDAERRVLGIWSPAGETAIVRLAPTKAGLVAVTRDGRALLLKP